MRLFHFESTAASLYFASKRTNTACSIADRSVSPETRLSSPSHARAHASETSGELHAAAKRSPTIVPIYSGLAPGTAFCGACGMRLQPQPQPQPQMQPQMQGQPYPQQPPGYAPQAQGYPPMPAFGEPARMRPFALVMQRGLTRLTGHMFLAPS